MSPENGARDESTSTNQGLKTTQQVLCAEWSEGPQRIDGWSQTVDGTPPGCQTRADGPINEQITGRQIETKFHLTPREPARLFRCFAVVWPRGQCVVWRWPWCQFGVLDTLVVACGAAPDELPRHLSQLTPSFRGRQLSENQCAEEWTSGAGAWGPFFLRLQIALQYVVL